MPDDIPSAAARLAALARDHGDRDGYPHMRDLVTLLPWLEGVAKGRNGELPELPRPAVNYADHSYPAFSAKQMRSYALASIVIALADAEAAAHRVGSREHE